MSVLADSVERVGKRVVLVIDDVHEIDDASSLDVVRSLRAVDGEALRVVLMAGGFLPQDATNSAAGASLRSVRNHPPTQPAGDGSDRVRRRRAQGQRSGHRRRPPADRRRALGAAVSGLVLRVSTISMSSAESRTTATSTRSSATRCSTRSSPTSSNSCSTPVSSTRSTRRCVAS